MDRKDQMTKHKTTEKWRDHNNYWQETDQIIPLFFIWYFPKKYEKKKYIFSLQYSVTFSTFWEMTDFSWDSYSLPSSFWIWRKTNCWEN